MAGATYAAQRVLRFLTHTYTRQELDTALSEAEDEWGNSIPTETQNPIANGLPCLLVDQEQNVILAEGEVVIREVTLYVASDDPLDAGDLVSNVVDQVGNVLLAGPLPVRWASGVAPSGPTVYKQAMIRVSREQM